jgi:hypothetical protein
MPHGFYKFSSPCDNSFYRKGDSFSEELRIGKVALWGAMKKICTSYKSKTLYCEAIEKLGEIGAFQGKPYLSYRDRKTGQTFYLRDYASVNKVLNGTYECDINVTKTNLLEVHENELTRGSENELTRGSENELTDPVKHAAYIRETVPSENTLQRIPLSLSLSNDNEPQIKQPKEEDNKKIILDNTEQPVVTILTIDQMIAIWKQTVVIGCESTPNRSTVDKLSKAFVEVFSSSLAKWGEFCNLIASSLYLMGETKQKFKLNLAWASKLESINQILDGHFTTGDRNNVIYYELEPITDPNPVVLQFKNACLDKFGKGRYISWIKPMKISFINNEIVCVAPTKFMANYVGSNDPLGFLYFVNQLPINRIVIKEPDGNVAGVIARKGIN